MTSFVSSPAPAATPPGTVIACGPFWPDIDVNHFRNAMRIGGTAIPDARLTEALLGAVVAVEHDLAAWQATQVLAGFATLVTVPQVQIGVEKRLVLLWRRAVYGFATADLAETHRDMTATATGQARAPELDMRADDHRRNAIHAIREILGKDRTTVELI